MKRVVFYIGSCLLWLTLVPLPRALAQGVVTRFERLGQEEGLSQGTITAIAQDQQGYMWFGTEDGLNRYDGYQFRLFRQAAEGPRTLNDNLVRGLKLGQDGRLWVTTFSGLSWYDPQSNQIQSVTAASGVPRDAIYNSVEIDGNGYAWTGMSEKGLLRVDPKDGAVKSYAYPFADRDDEDGVRILHWAKKRGQLLVGTRKGGLYLYDQEADRLRPFLQDMFQEKGLDLGIYALLEDQDGRLWIGTSQAGLVVVDSDTDHLRRFGPQNSGEHGLADPRIMALCQGKRGTLWVGTFQSGLYRWDPQGDRFIAYRYRPADLFSLSDDRILSIHEDRGGLLWVGTNNGISKLNPATQDFVHFRHDDKQNSLSHNRVKAIYEDRQGKLWIGTFGGGLDILDGDRFENMQEGGAGEGLSSNNVFAVAQDEQGRFLIGTWGGGLTLLDPQSGRTRHFLQDAQRPEGIDSNYVISIYQDGQNRIWVGTRNSLMRFFPDRGVFQPAGRKAQDGQDDLGEHSISAIQSKGDGRLWVGTYGGGLFLFDPDTDRVIQHRHDPDRSDSLGHDRVIAILKDSKGRLWLGTKGGGLNRYLEEEDRFTRFTREGGLPDDVIYGLLEDEIGHLWLSSNQGLIRYNPDSGQIRQFGPSHGIQGLEFNSHAFTKRADGRLVFGGVNGLTQFEPGRIHSNGHVPPIVFTDIKTLNRSIGDQLALNKLDKLTLSYRDTVVSFHFAALDFADPARNSYAYMLEGFDQNWQMVGAQRSATYTNLDWGHYRFRVKGANNDGLWAASPLTLAVEVHPPIWRTWWAHTFYAVFFFVLLVGAPILRIHFLKQRKRELEALVSERTKDLQATAMRLKDTQKQLLEAAHLAGMTEIAASVLHNIGNLLNSVNVSVSVLRDSLDETRFIQFFQRILDLIKSHHHDLGTFLTENQKGRKIPDALENVHQQMVTLNEDMKQEVMRLSNSLNKIYQIIEAQRKYARGNVMAEMVDVNGVLDDVILIHGNMSGARDIQVVKQYGTVRPIMLPKSKFMQVLINIFANAVEALSQSPPAEKACIWVRSQILGEEKLRIVIRDNGPGLAGGEPVKIFHFGYSTKVGRQGFGLHFCATAMTEMNGVIFAESEGPGKGTSLIVELPL